MVETHYNIGYPKKGNPLCIYLRYSASVFSKLTSLIATASQKEHYRWLKRFRDILVLFNNSLQDNVSI